MCQGYFAFPRRLWVKLPEFSANERLILLWVHGAVKYTGPDRGSWEGELLKAANGAGISKTSAHRALVSLHEKELIYTPAQSRWKLTKIRIIGFRTARNYPQNS